MDNKQVRFQGEEETQEDKQLNQANNQSKAPIIGVNDQYLDPYEVKNSLKEEEALEQENGISPYSIDDQADPEELLECLSIKLIPHRNPINLNQEIPTVLQISTKKIANKIQRPPIDLICLVDVSGSMIGKKINLVKDSLRYLMKILAPEDRICIVVFTTVAHILTPWTRNTIENKAFLKKTILDLKGLASTNIGDGMDKALWMLKNRKEKNPISCIFLLSDGQDDYIGAENRVADSIKSYDIQEKIVIHTFGYGNDHDSKVLNSIAKSKNGNFYFIENIIKVSDYFILAMSGMLSIYAQNINIELSTKDNCKIIKAYGEGQIWHKQDDHHYQIGVNYLLQGESKDYVFQLFVTSEDNNNQDTDILVTIQGELIKQQYKFKKQSILTLQITNDEQGMINDHVEINYLRAKSGEAIGEACLLSQNKKYEQATEIIDAQINYLKQSSQLNSQAMQIAMDDLEKCKIYCRPKIFELEGEAFLMKKQKNHIERQSSLTNIADWNEDQQANMNQLEKGELQLSACGSIKGSESDCSSQPDFDTYQNFDPRAILKHLLKIKQFDAQDDDENEEEEILIQNQIENLKIVEGQQEEQLEKKEAEYEVWENSEEKQQQMEQQQQQQQQYQKE